MAGRGLKRFKGLKGLILLLILAVLVVGYYFYLSNRTISQDSKPDETKVSAVQKVLLRDLEKNYPPSPKEVIKYYSDLTKCFYNEELSESDIVELATKAQQLYDDELVEKNNGGEYITKLKEDIQSFQDGNIVISSYTPSNSVDVEEFSSDGYKWARLYCLYTMRQGTKLYYTNEVFVLRQDADKHWKIYGWEVAEEEAGTN